MSPASPDGSNRRVFGTREGPPGGRKSNFPDTVHIIEFPRRHSMSIILNIMYLQKQKAGMKYALRNDVMSAFILSWGKIGESRSKEVITGRASKCRGEGVLGIFRFSL
jgi:hypothetical protein